MQGWGEGEREGERAGERVGERAGEHAGAGEDSAEATAYPQHTMIMSWQRGLRTKAPHATMSEAPSSGCGRSSPFPPPSTPLALASPSRWASRCEGAAKPASRDEPRSRVSTRIALKNIVAAAATKTSAEPTGLTICTKPGARKT